MTRGVVGVAVDALEPEALQQFWAAAAGALPGDLQLRFVRTDRPKTGKNRVHLDLGGGPAWRREVERLLDLGARRVDIGQGDVPWDVLADPEGNELCVLRPGHGGGGSGTGLVAICLDTPAEVLEAQVGFWRATSGWDDVEVFEGGAALRASAAGVALVVGPPAAPRTGRNRLRLDVVNDDLAPGEHLDPAGNELTVLPA